MPIISPISARSTKGRVVYAAMYLLLSLGAATMIYPLLIMIGGSVKSDTDFDRLSPWPEYLWNDDLLWTKYLQSKYTSLDNLERWHRVNYGSWRLVQPPKPLENNQLARDFRAFRATTLPFDFFGWATLNTSRSLRRAPARIVASPKRYPAGTCRNTPQ